MKKRLKRLEQAVAEHRHGVEAYVRSASGIGPEEWGATREGGKWSPAQITEHLVLFYEAVLVELEGGAGLRMRVGPVMRRLLRWFLLPHILFHRSFPIRAVAPRALRPSEAAAGGAEVLLERLREVTARFEEAATSSEPGGRSLNHPYFGPLPIDRGVRFSAVHLEHHRRQLEESVAGRGT
jgi:hypothetical protein